jgi:PEP-CTERM motif
MPRRARLAILTYGLMLLLVSGITPARADLVASVSVDIMPEGGGMSLYSYAITVDPTSTLAVSEFDLNLTSGTTSGINTPVGAPLSSIMMPTGFINLYTLGDPTISFFSTSEATDIAPGGFGIFSFISTSNPTTLQPYQLTSFDGSGGTVTGSILGPTSAPEPSSLVLFGLGAMGLMGWLARVRSRKHGA